MVMPKYLEAHYDHRKYHLNSGGNAAEANFRSNFGVPVLAPPQERFMRFTGISYSRLELDFLPRARQGIYSGGTF